MPVTLPGLAGAMGRPTARIAHALTPSTARCSRGHSKQGGTAEMAKHRSNSNQLNDLHGLGDCGSKSADGAASGVTSPAASVAPVSNPQSAEDGFDLDAGIVCLDFVNTLARRSGEHLNSYMDLLAFVVQSGLVTPAEGNRLRMEASRK